MFSELDELRARVLEWKNVRIFPSDCWRRATRPRSLTTLCQGLPGSHLRFPLATRVIRGQGEDMITREMCGAYSIDSSCRSSKSRRIFGWFDFRTVPNWPSALHRRFS